MNVSDNNLKRPKSKKGFPDLNPFDTIFLLYPIWNDDLFIYDSFIKNSDFTDKTVIRICPHEPSGICRTYQYIKDFIVEANVIVIDFNMYGTKAGKPEAKQEIEKWLKSFGY